jgi:hypothetical protein
MLTSYGLCWNPSLGTWDVKWRVGVELCLAKIESAPFAGADWGRAEPNALKQLFGQTLPLSSQSAESKIHRC